MNNTNIKIEGHVNLFCKTDLWKALDSIHKEYGVNKSEILISFVEHHFTKKDDLLVGVLNQVEKSLQDRLAQIQAAKKGINQSTPKPSISIVNNTTVVELSKPKPVVKYKKSSFAVALESAIDKVEVQTPVVKDESELTQDLNFAQFRYKRYEDLEQIGSTLAHSEFIASKHLHKKWMNGFYAMQASQALDLWKDGNTIAQICHKQPIQFENRDTQKLDQRSPTIQTMFRRLMKQIAKHGSQQEKAYLFKDRS